MEACLKQSGVFQNLIHCVSKQARADAPPLLFDDSQQNYHACSNWIKAMSPCLFATIVTRSKQTI